MKQLVLDGTGPLGVAKDMDRLCPRYGRLGEQERRLVWNRFFQALAFAESGYDYEMVYRETWGGVSVGLLQLSTVDNEAWGCRFSESDVYAPKNPRENLECGVEILALQMALCGTVFQGFPESTDCGGRTAHGVGGDYSFYWATLNPKDASGPEAFRVFADQWKSWTGWDPVTKTRVGEGKELRECFAD